LVSVATALITGPTSGIGRGFTEAFARKGLDLVLVSRNWERLSALADEMTATYGVGAEVIVADLSSRSDTDRVAARLTDRSRPVVALVNNAGFTLNRNFLKSSIEDEQRSIDVMITAVLRLTHAAVPGMVERGTGMIVNVSSVAGWLTGGTYSASKAWVTVFTESLALDLQGTGVRTTAVCPGFVHTEFHERAGIDMSSVPDFLWLDVDQVVAQAFTDLARGRPTSIAGGQYRVASSLLRHGPRSITKLAVGARRRTKRFGVTEDDMGDEDRMVDA
jgi:short-subunit dehydrogenase